MLLSVSLLIRGLVQYKMREGYKRAEGNLPRVDHNKAKLTNPTYKILYDALKYNYFERRGRSSYSYNFHNDFNKLQVITLLKFMEMTGVSIVYLLLKVKF